MKELADVLTVAGPTGFILVVAAFILIWWFTKGRKRSEELKERQIAVMAENGEIIKMCTAVIQNNSVVIEANTLQRKEDTKCLERLEDCFSKQGSQLDEIQRKQAICMDRQEHQLK